uniref:Nicastrin n=1 Tax=Acrobeloides nanus TaxID=290746 RepID=A0A914C6G8_9BILA
MQYLSTYISLKFFLYYLVLVHSERLKDQITVQLDSGKHDCFTLLNGTNQIGCQSNPQGNAGTLILVNHAAELENSSNQIGDIIVAVNIEQLTKTLVDSLISTKSIKGVILFRNQTNLQRTNSEDSSCPNQEFSFYKSQESSCEWNKKGAVHPSGLRFLDWKKPVLFITNETEVDLIVNKCIKAFNFDSSNTSPKCTAKMTMRMHAAGDAQICLRRQQLFSGLSDTISLCDPLGDENIFAIVPHVSKIDQPNVFMLTTRLDTFSMFTNNDGGDVSVLTSLISSLVVANAIGQNLENFQSRAKANNKQIMFGFLHGESLGYIGSSRMVFDMNLGKFPVEDKGFSPNKSAHSLSLNDIKLYLELQHIGFEADLKNYFIHLDPHIYSKFKLQIDQAINSSVTGMKINGFKLRKTSIKSNAQVPPSSYHTLLKHEAVPGFIISTADQFYQYKDTNSLLDKALREDHERTFRSSVIKHITAAATSSLYTILNHVLSTDPTQEKDYVIKQDFIEKLVDCFFYTENWSCSFFNEILNITQKADFGNRTFALNVNNSAQCKTLNEGQNLFSFNWQFDPITNKSYCYKTSVYRTPASSPAFEIEDYDFLNGTYSTWVESVWDPRRLELYVSTGYTTDLIVLLFGILFFATSLLVCRKMNIESWLDDPVLLPNRPEPL